LSFGEGAVQDASAGGEPTALTRKERKRLATAEAIARAFTEIIDGILRVAMVSGRPERAAAARWLQALLNSDDFGFRIGGVEGSGAGAPRTAGLFPSSSRS
jgi:hypothetical protein